MNKTVIGALMIFIFIVAGAVGVKLLLPYFEEIRQKTTSDAVKTKGKIRIDLDNWIGYFPLRSSEMKNLMRRSGYILLCNDDNADYAARMKRLKSDETDFAVATVDSFILNAKPQNYPGTIVMVIDESKGGDALLARKDKIADIDDIKGKADIRVALTPGSPSHYLAKAVAYHFNVPELLPSKKLLIETKGSAKACDKLIAGKTDIAVCWEPDVSRALDSGGTVKILGSEDTEHLIVDVLLVSRKFVQKNPDVISLFLSNYFNVLKKYRENPDLLFEHVKREISLPDELIRSMLKGVKWVNFSENCEKWFGISAPGGCTDEGLTDTIDSTVRILVNAGDFSQNPIPGEDPYRLINSSFLEKLFVNGISGFSGSGFGKSIPVSFNSIAAIFTPLDEAHWNSLKEVGTLKLEPIAFQRGSADLDILARQLIDKAVERLWHYPNFRILIKAHTGIRGDKDENRLLSQKRADAVARYLTNTHSIDNNRIKAIGFGGTKPLIKKPGETKRAWHYRLPRVEIVLVREEY